MDTSAQQLIALMREAIARCRLDLSELTVLTEAASGAYVVTPVLAAMSGARAIAIARDSRFGAADEVARDTLALARMAKVADRLEIVSAKHREAIAAADIITNSGHVRPIDREMIASMKTTAVIPLMYEAWEFRAADLDLDACRARSIPVAGTNERHPAIEVFRFLGPLAERLLAEAGLAVRECRIVVLCDNPFRDFMVAHLRKAAAEVHSIERLAPDGEKIPAGAILVATAPAPRPVIASAEAEIIARRFPGALVAQFLGDIDRGALAHHGVRYWPLDAPPAGHQGIMLSTLGAEPIVCLQAGGLKVGELMARVCLSEDDVAARCERAVAAAVASGFGQSVFGGRASS